MQVMKVLYMNASDTELFTNNALLLGTKELNTKNIPQEC
jgi:hypothetical protein